MSQVSTRSNSEYSQPPSSPPNSLVSFTYSSLTILFIPDLELRNISTYPLSYIQCYSIRLLLTQWNFLFSPSGRFRGCGSERQRWMRSRNPCLPMLFSLWMAIILWMSSREILTPKAGQTIWQILWANTKRFLEQKLIPDIEWKNRIA